MKTKLFLTAFLLLLISSGTSASANPMPEFPTAAILPAVDDHEESNRHTGQVDLFPVPASGESGFNFSDRLPNSNSEEHSKDKIDRASSSDLIQRNCSFFFLDYPQHIECSQSIKILLFPFHSFL